MSVESVWTCGDYTRALFISRSRLRVQRASGIPCALYLLEGQINARLGRIASREGGHMPARTAVRFRAIVRTNGPEACLPDHAGLYIMCRDAT
jgi:hypothetical protein